MCHNGKLLHSDHRVFDNILWFVISPNLKEFYPFLHQFHVLTRGWQNCPIFSKFIIATNRHTAVKYGFVTFIEI